MSDDSNSLNVSPEFKQLSEECELLKEELAALFAEWEELTQVVIPNIEADYVVKIGTLQHELLQIQIDIQRTKREIDLIQAAINRGETVDTQQVLQQIEYEFAQWKAKLDSKAADIKSAQQRLSSLMSDEDSAELQKLYRALAKKLHPDVNPDQSQEAQNLWLQVQNAYEIGDLKQLQALHLLASDIPNNYDLPNSIDLLKKRRSNLAEQIKNTRAKIAELKKLPIFQWEECFENQAMIAEKQQFIMEQIEQSKEQRSKLLIVLNQLKQGINNE